MNKKSTTETIVALIVFLFLYTALSKYTDINMFKFSLNQSPILKHFSNFIAITLPGLEIGIVILLIVPKTRLLGLYTAASLLMVFTIYLIGMVTFSKDLPCGCGGVVNFLSWKWHIVFNVFFIILSIWGFKVQKQIVQTTIGRK